MTLLRDSHVVRVIVCAASPAAEVEGALVEQLAVGGRQEVGAQDHKRICPHQKSVFHTPPLVIVEVALQCE